MNVPLATVEVLLVMVDFQLNVYNTLVNTALYKDSLAILCPLFPLITFVVNMMYLQIIYRWEAL